MICVALKKSVTKFLASSPDPPSEFASKCPHAWLAGCPSKLGGRIAGLALEPLPNGSSLGNAVDQVSLTRPESHCLGHLDLAWRALGSCFLELLLYQLNIEQNFNHPLCSPHQADIRVAFHKLPTLENSIRKACISNSYFTHGCT